MKKWREIVEEIPEEELRGVVEPEHVVVVFDVILIEQRVKLLKLER